MTSTKNKGYVQLVILLCSCLIAYGQYHTGPRGGCFIYSGSGKKQYVDHSFCGSNPPLSKRRQSTGSISTGRIGDARKALVGPSGVLALGAAALPKGAPPVEPSKCLKIVGWDTGSTDDAVTLLSTIQNSCAQEQTARAHVMLWDGNDKYLKTEIVALGRIQSNSTQKTTTAFNPVVGGIRLVSVGE